MSGATLFSQRHRPDVPDKIITLAIVYFIIKGLPKKLTALYDASSDIQSLD